MKTWTDEETRKLEAIYNCYTNEQLCEALPNKSFLAIYKKAKSLGLKRDKAIKFKNRSKAKKKEEHKQIVHTNKGYRLIYKPDHPRADKKGYVFEHIVVFEENTGVKVPMNCCVHHLNGNKSDNRIENLCLMLFSAHTSFHNLGRKQSFYSRKIISKKAKERFANKENHPAYKDVNINAIKEEIAKGKTIKEVCKEYGICRSTYYSKIKEETNE